ncbi:MAG: PaaI family thioesterase [Burkholderiales bacterium]
MTTPHPDWPGLCFGCSPRNPVGLQLRVERTAQGCRTHHLLAGHFCGVEGIAHGGIVSTLLDEVAAWALILHTGKLGLTSEMATRFLTPVRTGTPLMIEAWIDAADARRAATRAEIRSTEGSLLASAKAAWALASAGVVARMSGLDRGRLDEFFAAVRPVPRD